MCGLPSALHPVEADSPFIAAKRGNYDYTDCLFDGNISSVIQKLLGITSATFNFPEGRFTPPFCKKWRGGGPFRARCIFRRYTYVWEMEIHRAS